ALADIPLASMLRQAVQRAFTARGDTVHLTDVTLGYDLRCTQPIPFDIDYTRTLGYGAVSFLMRPPEDESLAQFGFVCLDGVDLKVLNADALRDPQTGRTRVR